MFAAPNNLHLLRPGHVPGRSDEARQPNFAVSLLPAMPSALAALRRELAHRVVDLEAVTRIVRADLGLTTKVIYLSRIGAKPDDKLNPLHVCLVEVGLEALRELANSTFAIDFSLLGQNTDAFERLWSHSKCVAGVAEQIAAYWPSIDHEAAYLAGLVQDLGMTWDLVCTEEDDQLCRYSYSRKGSSLAIDWNFPTFLVESISYRHDAERIDDPILTIVSAADECVSEVDSGNVITLHHKVKDILESRLPRSSDALCTSLVRTLLESASYYGTSDMC